MAASRRRELNEFIETGNMRDALSRYNGTQRLSQDAIDLVIDICCRYCEPRPRPRKGGSS